jgi:hypothetical protein
LKSLNEGGLKNTIELKKFHKIEANKSKPGEQEIPSKPVWFKTQNMLYFTNVILFWFDFFFLNAEKINKYNFSKLPKFPHNTPKRDIAEFFYIVLKLRKFCKKFCKKNCSI